jgi:hypothetical protein
MPDPNPDLDPKLKAKLVLDAKKHLGYTYTTGFETRIFSEVNHLLLKTTPSTGMEIVLLGDWKMLHMYLVTVVLTDILL